MADEQHVIEVAFVTKGHQEADRVADTLDRIADKAVEGSVSVDAFERQLRRAASSSRQSASGLRTFEDATKGMGASTSAEVIKVMAALTRLQNFRFTDTNNKFVGNDLSKASAASLQRYVALNRELMASLKGVDAATDVSAGSMAGYTQQVRAAGEATAKTAQQMNSLEGGRAGFAVKFGNENLGLSAPAGPSVNINSMAATNARLAQSSRDAKAELQGLGKSATTTGNSIQDTSTAIDKSTVGLQGLRYALYDVSSSFRMVRDAATGFLGGTIGTAIDFERNFAEVIRTVVDGGAAIKNELIALTFDIPESFEDIADIAVLGGQLGIDAQGGADAILAFTDTVAKMAATTDLSMELAGTALGRFQALLGVEYQDFERLGSAILRVGVNSVATETSIVRVATQISSMATYAGITAQDTVALAGALASVGVPPELSRGVVTRLFTRMSSAIADGGHRLDEFARIAGVSSGEFRRAFGTDFGDTLQQFFKGVGRMKEEGEDAARVLADIGIQGVRDVPVLIRLGNATDVVSRAFIDARYAWETGTELTEHFGIIANTTSAKITRLGNAFTALGDSMGKQTLGPINDVVQMLLDAATWLNDFLQTGAGMAASRWVLGFTAIAAALAGVGTAIVALGAGMLAVRISLDAIRAQAGSTGFSMNTLRSIFVAKTATTTADTTANNLNTTSLQANTAAVAGNSAARRIHILDVGLTTGATEKLKQSNINAKPAAMGLTRALGWLTVAALGVAAVDTLGNWIKDMHEASLGIDSVDKALQQVQDHALSSEGLDMFADWMPKIMNATSAISGLGPSGILFSATLDAMRSFGTDSVDIARTLKAVSFDGFWGLADPLRDFDRLDDQLITLSTQSVPQFAVEFERARDKMIAAGYPLEEVNKLLDDSSKLYGELTPAAREAIDGYRELADAVGMDIIDFDALEDDMQNYLVSIADGFNRTADELESIFLTNRAFFPMDIGSIDDLREFTTSISKQSEKFVSFKDILSELREEQKAWAEESGTEYDGVAFSLSAFGDKLTRQVDIQKTYMDNMATLIAAGGRSIVPLMDSLDSEDAALLASKLVGDLADGVEGEFERIVALSQMYADQTAQAWITEMLIKQGFVVDAAGKFGTEVAASVASAFASSEGGLNDADFTAWINKYAQLGLLAGEEAQAKALEALRAGDADGIDEVAAEYRVGVILDPKEDDLQVFQSRIGAAMVEAGLTSGLQFDLSGTKFLNEEQFRQNIQTFIDEGGDLKIAMVPGSKALRGLIITTQDFLDKVENVVYTNTKVNTDTLDESVDAWEFNRNAYDPLSLNAHVSVTSTSWDAGLVPSGLITGATGGLVRDGDILPKFSRGGGVGSYGQFRGPGTGTSDDILARVSNGEFINTAASVRHYGAQFFDMINRRQFPTMRELSGMMAGASQGGPQSVTNVNVTQNYPQTVNPLTELKTQSENLVAGIWGS